MTILSHGLEERNLHHMIVGAGIWSRVPYLGTRSPEISRVEGILFPTPQEKKNGCHFRRERSMLMVKDTVK